MSNWPVAEERQGLLAVARDRDVKALAFQPHGEGVDEGLLVLDDENLDALFAGWASWSLRIQR